MVKVNDKNGKWQMASDIIERWKAPA